MKKIISIIICISLLSSIICIPVSATEEVVVSESIEKFCEDVNEMITEYSDSEFVTPEFIEEEQTTENTDEEIEINYCPRLIVQSDKPIYTYNAIDVVSGFSNFSSGIVLFAIATSPYSTPIDVSTITNLPFSTFLL